jgi:beta-galactosidase
MPDVPAISNPWDNTAIINIGHADLSPYKLVVVPADYLMDVASAEAIRGYVSRGGTVLMTAFSAKVDEHGQWFSTPLPGLLSDVFGMKKNEFYDAESPPEVRSRRQRSRNWRASI